MSIALQNRINDLEFKYSKLKDKIKHIEERINVVEKEYLGFIHKKADAETKGKKK